tara:strand:- start:538 stop:1116 length:579 start_codon:yes stop_codon:yes gene_type:complete
MIILIDNYDSFTYNLVHYFEELGQKVVVYRNDERTCEEVLNKKCKYIVISPGPSEPKKSGICLELIKENSKRLKPIPMIGVCLGHQAIAEAFSGSVIQSGDPVHGKVSKIKHDNSKLFEGIKNPFNATRYHSLIVEKKSLPNCFDVISMTESGIIMGIKHKKFPFYGVQFHPESIATEFGHKLLENFLKVFK